MAPAFLSRVEEDEAEAGFGSPKLSLFSV